MDITQIIPANPGWWFEFEGQRYAVAFWALSEELTVGGPRRIVFARGANEEGKWTTLVTGLEGSRCWYQP